MTFIPPCVILINGNHASVHCHGLPNNYTYKTQITCYFDNGLYWFAFVLVAKRKCETNQNVNGINAFFKI